MDTLGAHRVVERVVIRLVQWNVLAQAEREVGLHNERSRQLVALSCDQKKHSR